MRGRWQGPAALVVALAPSDSPGMTGMGHRAARRASHRAAVLSAVAVATGCMQPVSVPPATAISRPWMFGIEPMRGDPLPQLPYTNRFIADLSAMPNVQVVYVGDERNSFLFNAWRGDKVLLAPWLGGGGNCMNLTYTVFQSGEKQAVLGLIVARMPAGTEPDSACVDRAATQFYQALVLQRL
jgi:hypothetical protein